MTHSLGFLTRFEGLGPSLIRQVFDGAPKGAINMGLGQPDLSVHPHIQRAVQDEVARGAAPYTPNAGRLEVREAIAALYTHQRACGFGLGDWMQPEGVVVTVGAQEALFVAMASMLEAGDEVLVPDPGFSAYAMIARVLGARVVPYALRAEDGFQPDPEELRSKCTSATKVCVLNSPSNPLGTVIEAERMRAICAVLDEKGVAYVSDEIYDQYTYVHQKPTSPSLYSKRGVVVGGLSKSVALMGWRVGWVVVSPENARVMTAVHQAVCSCVSSLSQAAAVAGVDVLLGRGDLGGVLSGYVDGFRARRGVVLKALDEAGIERSGAEGAFYVFAHIAPHIGDLNTVVWCKDLAQQGLITIPGEAFGERGAGWVRLAYTTERVREGVEQFCKAVQGG